MKRAERLHALSEMLRRQGARGSTADRLAAEFGVSVRTIKRDIAALEVSGVPLWSRPGPGGGYGLSARATLPPVSLTPTQAVSLLAAVSATSDAPYSDLAAAGVHKIMDVLDSGTRERARQLAARVWVDPAELPSRQVMSSVEQAMTDQRVLRLLYAPAESTPTTRDVEPVLFASTKGRWYLVGWCRLRGAMRWFRLDRIQSATATSDPCGGHTIAEVGEPPPAARSVAILGATMPSN